MDLSTFTVISFLNAQMPKVLGQFDSSRCKCHCQSLNLTRQNLFIKSVSDSSKCHCQSVVTGIPEHKLDEYCGKCECGMEYRHIWIIKMMVMIAICSTGALSFYMLFLLCLNPMLIIRRTGRVYHRQENEEDDNMFIEAEPQLESTTSRRRKSSSSVRQTVEVIVNKVKQQRNEWIENVHEQRRNIFDNHTMLN